MTELKTIRGIEAALAKYIPITQEITGKDITLGRMHRLMAVVGNPEKQLKIVHIAGTSGKTSTTYYIAALLQATGKKVGMTVSPHVDSVAERVQINSVPLGAPEFGKALSEFISLIEAAGIEPTYFELLIGFVYWYFAKVKVDYAVIETGLGGLHDGTNIAERPDKLCVITDIGFDHMHVLGNTLPEIALQKAGIIYPKNYALMLQQPEQVTEVFEEWCKAKQAKLKILDPAVIITDPSVQANLKELPQYQQRNWSLAYAAYIYVSYRDKLNMLSTEQLAETMHVQVPGRMDTVEITGKTLVMDGAHNHQKMMAFASSFQKKYLGQKTAVLLSLKQDKQFKEVLPLIKKIANTVILTTFSITQDRPAISTPPAELAKAAKAAGIKNVIIEPDQDKAYQALLDQPEKLLIITGSFYLIGQLRQKHGELHARS